MFIGSGPSVVKCRKTLFSFDFFLQDGLDKSNCESVNGAAKAIAEEMAEQIMTEKKAESEKLVENDAEKKVETDSDGGVDENGGHKNSRQQKVPRYSNW